MDLSKICDAVDKVYMSNRIQDSRPTTDFIFPADSSSVNDNKGHFPIPDVEHGRNAIARVNQYTSLPKWYEGNMNLKQLVEHVVNEVHKKFPSIEVSKDAKIPKPAQVKDSEEKEYSEFVEFFSGDHTKEEIKEKVKEYRKKFGDRTITTPERKELVAFAEYQDGTPVYSYKQKAWEKIEDCGVTTSTDVDAEITGKTKSVEDSRQDEVISYSWDEFEQKLNDYKELNAHSVVIGDKTYILSGMVVEDEVKDLEPVQDDADKTYTVYRVGGSIGEKYDFTVKGRRAHKVESGLSLEEAKDRVKVGNANLSKGEKSYYGIRYSYMPDDKITDSSDYRIEDDREYSKQQLIDRPPLWIKDKDIWEKAVDKATRGGSKDTTVVVPIVIYKRMGGTKAMNKKEKEERAAADERRMQAETSREGVEDSMFDKIKVGDTLRIVRGDHVGRFAEVLEVKEDGSYRLKDLQTNEEFEEPANLFGVRVTVTDSGYSDSEDEVSLRSALATILKETDPKVRQRSIQSKVLSFLNAYGMDAEIESDGKIWLNDDDTSVRVDESTVSIKKGGESETEDYALLEDIEKWYGRIKELSGK
nr:MAG TPA: Transcription elongation factor [Caudoviricetes sp.]